MNFDVRSSALTKSLPGREIHGPSNGGFSSTASSGEMAVSLDLNQAIDRPMMTATPAEPAANGPQGCSLTARQRTRPSSEVQIRCTRTSADAQRLAMLVDTEYDRSSCRLQVPRTGPFPTVKRQHATIG